jgi:hypothetical protein
MILLWRMMLVDPLTKSVVDASEHFLTTEPYSYIVEFKNRRDNSGTRMPLTLYCYDLHLTVTKSLGNEPYAARSLRLSGSATLTKIGHLKLAFMKEAMAKNEVDGFFDRTTAGTIALWFLRKQERRRQLMAIKKRSKDADWIKLHELYKQFLPIIVPIYQKFFRTARDYLIAIEKDRDWERIRTNIRNYIRDQKKTQTSTVSQVYDRLPYVLVLESADIPKLVHYYIKFLDLLIDNFYSTKRVHPNFILSAIRNRPLDLNEFSSSRITGYMDRSREANGEPPESIIYMFIYEIKKTLIKMIISAFEEVYKVKIIDPIRDRDFYYKYTQKEDGLYIFGDNGAIIRKGKIIGIYDLSISDIFQAWVRQHDRKNFCIFLRLDEGYDSGSTGDCLTTIWNIEGQLFIWWAYLNGYLTTSEEIPIVKDLLEETKGFLGMYYSSIINDFFSSGVKLTRDSVKKAIPLTLNRFGQTKLDWKPRENVKKNEILALLISSGLGDIKLTEFFDWVRRNRLDDSEEEMYSLVEKIEAWGKGPDFIDLTDMDLEKLAFPYEIT